MSVLSEASKAYAANRSRDQYDELIVAMMICTTRDDEVLAPGRTFTNNKGQLDVQLGRVQASDGKWYYVVCTSQEELKKIDGASGVHVKLSDLLRRVKHEEETGGLCLDPMNGANCFISKDDACVMLDNLATAHTKE